ncbi:MAG: hypothetical protein QHJ81_07520 [Anaerolineae bacterium]|nr:hypothetical protein [Anaerolineae bacterium]
MGLNLSLNYSSEWVNSIRQGPSGEDEQKAKTFSRQASIVGWGWSLGGLGQITVKLPQAQKYYLEFAGGSFELKWTADGWQTEPQSFLRIEHSQDGLFDNNPWYVWAPDGTRYTFGSTGGWGANGQHWVRNTGSCGRHMLAMHLTEVRDTHGNRAVVTYATETRDITCPDGSSQPYVRAIRPTRIEYFAVGEPLATVRVDFAYTSRSDTGVPGKNNPYVEAFWSDSRLQTITVKVRNGTGADSFATVRSYDLTQDYLWKDQASGQGLLRLTSITEKGRDGGALPAWTFSYLTLPGGDWLNYTLLSTADNGQGGRVTYSYEDVDNIWMEGCGGNTKRFRVSQMEIRDGLGTAAHNITRMEYNHQNPWAWTGPGFPECPDFEFGGYNFVRRQVKDGAGVLYQVVDDYFHQKNADNTLDPRKGKLYLSVTSTQPGSGELGRVETTWSTVVVKGTNWVFRQDETRRLGNSSQKTAYEYQTAYQGGAQYGNVTHVREYSDGGATLYRTQESEYYPNNVAGSVYLINRPARQRLLNASGACRGETRYIYDNAANYQTPPTKGDLTKIQVAQTSCGTSWSETTYSYDSYGNQTGVTDPLGNVTTMAYDTGGSWPKLFAYPTSTTAPLVGTTSYTWDKVLGQVTGVTDPNGVSTGYEYDQWGRLWKEIRPGDDTNNPTRRLSYNNYAGSAAPFWVKEERRDNRPGDATSYLETRTFYDGLGRVVQTQAEAASGSQSIVVSTQYTPLGLMQ